MYILCALVAFRGSCTMLRLCVPVVFTLGADGWPQWCFSLALRAQSPCVLTTKFSAERHCLPVTWSVRLLPRSGVDQLPVLVRDDVSANPKTKFGDLFAKGGAQLSPSP